MPDFDYLINFVFLNHYQLGSVFASQGVMINIRTFAQ